MQFFLGFLHGIDYIFNYFLIGSIIFYCLILPAGGKSGREISPNWIKNIQCITVLSFISSFLWMILSVHDMAESWRFADIWMGMGHTSFARVWCLKLFFMIVFVLLLKVVQQKWISTLLVVSTILLPIPYMLTGHASSIEDHSVLRMASDFVHSISVGIWTGGLMSLFLWLGKRLKYNAPVEPLVSFQIVTRFSHFAMTSTFLIGLTGVLTAWLNGVSLLQPWKTNYGELVMAKLIFFCLALGAAAINQFLHLRTWNPNSEKPFASAIRREVGLELILVLIVFIIAGFLSRTSLPGG